MNDRPFARYRTRWLLASTPIVLLLTHYAALLPHEFAHSCTAWILGIKGTPGDLYWGPPTFGNVLLLYDIDKNVDYTTALDAGHTWQVAAVAFAGPGLANGGLFLVSRWLLTRPYFTSRPSQSYVLFWFYVMNAANLWCYVPLRVFAGDGDVHHFLLATGISPWWIYVVGGYAVLRVLVDMYRVPLPTVLANCEFTAPAERAIVLVTTTAITYGYFAVPGLLEDDSVSLFMARTAVLAIPVIVLVNWRRLVPTTPQPGFASLRHSELRSRPADR